MNNSSDNNELDVNKKNREDYEKLMSDSSSKLDGYWDKNDAFVKLLLLVLGLVIVVGVGYYVMLYFKTK